MTERQKEWEECADCGESIVQAKGRRWRRPLCVKGTLMKLYRCEKNIKGVHHPMSIYS